MVELEASDLFISVESPPLAKVDGEMRPLENTNLDAEHNCSLIYSLLNEQDVSEFESHHELNKSLHLPDTGRFRVNVFRQRGEPAMVARHVKASVPSIDQLGLPAELKEFAMMERGLILVVGATGTGKSTTLAAMIDHRNSQRAGHILTIEDPIEFIHTNKRSLVNQREIGIDTHSYEAALKNALRETPDVILVGEIRDRETMRHAINYAETGHLCLSTLHANNANQTLTRIINFFPEDARAQLLQDLSLNLQAIVAQRLCVDRDERRVAAVEFMSRTPFIAQLIERGKIDEIKEAMEKSQGRVSKTFDQALFELVHAGRITEEEALRHADSRNNLALRFRLEGTGSHKAYPVKSEYTLAENAPFDTYSKFRIVPIKVDQSNPGVEQRINTALVHVFDAKGLAEDPSSADIDVQYIYGIKSTKDLKMEPVADEGNSFEYYRPQSKQHHMFVVNVVDLKTRKPIYRLTASRRKSESQATEAELNRIFVDLLKSLPVGKSDK
jgi:twitching motility protein PilU